MGVKVKERPKGSGVWWIFVDHQGRRKAKKVGDKKMALEAARKIEAKLALGDLGIIEDKPKAPLFKDYAELRLNGYIKSMRRQSTFERYQDVLKRHINPTLGKRPINEIKRGEIRDLLLKLNRNGLSRSTICLVRDVISGPLSFAFDEELIPVNPASGITKKLQLRRDRKIEIEPLTTEEVRLFLENCQAHAPEHYPAFLCAFRTGMRLGELLGLQWGDIDWHGKFIRVSRSYKLGRMTPTKTGKVRRVDMSDHLIEALRNLYIASKQEALKEGKGEIIDIIFHRGGKPMEQNYIQRVFKRILARSGLREIRLHDVRHTYASLLLSDGVAPVYV
ncbi:MAG TPA: site-specific integrase, partial [Desulfobacterales bacterium]|nr:site-specific integrase [Desulfobacterales bacterium]